MREAVRQQYLQAMGIPVWVPRQELPNAAPSNLLPVLGEGTHLHGTGDMSADHLPAAGDSQRGAHMAAQLLGGAAPVASAPAPANPTPAPAAAVERPAQAAPVSSVSPASTEADTPVVDQPATAPQNTAVAQDKAASLDGKIDPTDLTPPRFELHFVKFGDAVVWVCDDFNELGNLLAFAPRVCAAMGWEVLRGEPVMFRWPFIENAREDQSAAVAEQALRAQWNFFAHHGAKLAIGLGTNARRWLQHIDVPGAYMDHSVLTVMQQGALKKQLWQQLLTVRNLANDS